MRNIILCGFMGCGKTTVGKLLAKCAKMEYLDLDVMIEDTAGKSIPAIFREDGEDVFRNMEHEIMISLAKRISCVVSTGGGAMTYARNVQAVCKEDVVVFLDADFGVCYHRIQYSDRPLVKETTREDLQRIFEERRSLYVQAATVTVDAARAPHAVVTEILSSLPN